MRLEIKRDVLEVLEELIGILEIKESKDIIEIKHLSDYTLNDSFIFQDEDSISIGVLIYALSKTIERIYEDSKASSKLMDLIIGARDCLRKDNLDAYREDIKKIFDLLSSVDAKLKSYVQEVIANAKVKKGFKLFEQGMSIAKASKLMGITRWELMDYVGNTTVFDREDMSINMKKRLAYTRSLFK